MESAEFEVEYTENDNEGASSSGSACKRNASKRQATLDAYLCRESGRKLFVAEGTSKKKPKDRRKSIAITHSVTSKNEFNVNKSFGTVVDEVKCCEEKCPNDWVRMSTVIDKARTKAKRTTLDKYVERKPNSSPVASNSNLVENSHSVLDSLRSYQDMYPDLSNRSASDVVLISVNSIRPGVLPLPFPNTCADPTYGWDYGRRFVRLPYSSRNMRNGYACFDTIQGAISKLLRPLQSYKWIEECIKSYTWNKHFDALSELFETVLDDSLRLEYLTSVVPFMAELVLQSPNLITQPIPLLRRGNFGSVTISQQQAACLLANAFFCTFPCRSVVGNDLPFINFGRLFNLQTSNAVEKLRCLLHYFHMISKKMPTGILTFRRQHSLTPNWSSMHLPLSKLYVNSTGTIEDDGCGMLQVDFANEYIGGGVLGGGCVQEEIRFLICPELIVSMLLCERMGPDESIVICGAQRFSDYVGYSSSFRWRRMTEEGSSPRDRFERLCCEVVAIDALPFSRKHEQFNMDLVDRELLKAYSGFAVHDGTFKPVATGNWGCGVFGGDLDLKSLIQLLAASAQKRPLCYFTFGNQQFAEDFSKIYKVLLEADFTVGLLYDIISAYCADYNRIDSVRLFDYLTLKIKSNEL